MIFSREEQAVDIGFMLEILPRLLRVLLTTLQISVVALLLGTLFGLLFGVLRVIGPRILYPLIDAYVFLVRSTPFAVQVYAAFFLLPRIGLDLPLFVVGVIALLFNSTGYQVEIVRPAIESVDKEQRDAAAALGMSRWLAMWLIILPQAARRMIPPLTNELANLVKASSVLSIIAVYELTRAGQAIIASSYKFAEVLILVAALYFLTIQLLSWGAAYLEKHLFTYRGGQPTQPTSATHSFTGASS
jgi:polar amino acid transport system permease protein